MMYSYPGCVFLGKQLCRLVDKLLVASLRTHIMQMWILPLLIVGHGPVNSSSLDGL